MNHRYQPGLLSSGESRHLTEWEFPGLPRLVRKEPKPRTIYQRQKAFAPPVRRRQAIAQLLNALRPR